MPTQEDQAEDLIEDIETHFPALAGLNDKLQRLLDDAQNPPPQGRSDGTITALRYKQLRSTSNAVSTLLASLLFHEARTKPRVPEELSDEEIDDLFD